MNGPGEFDLENWIARSGLSVAFDGPWNGKDHRWILDPCPWNDAHANRSAYIVRFANGAIAAGCHHNSCQGHDWHSLRDRVEPNWRDRLLRDQYGQQRQAGKASSVGSVGRENVKPPRSLPPYRPFPITELPVTLREYVEAGAAAIGCDAALIALPALTVAGGCIGNSRALLVKRKWIEPPVIWAVTIGYSGDRKSPGYDAAVAPLLEIQMNLVDSHQEEVACYNEELHEWKEKPKVERGEEPERPNDLTLVDERKRRPHVLALDSRAKQVWVNWYNRWGECIAASEGEQAASLAKLEGYAVRYVRRRSERTCRVRPSRSGWPPLWWYSL